MNSVSSPQWRVLVAAGISTVLIIGAYFLARGFGSPESVKASSESELLQAIATKDTDGDGLPDWEEALFGTDPKKTDTFNLGMTDGEAVAKGLIVPKAIADAGTATTTPSVVIGDDSLPTPVEGTLTAAFAKSFYTLYIAAKQAKGGADLTQDDLSNIAKQAIANLSDSVKASPDFKSASDLTISGSGAEAMKAFAISAEAVLLKNTNIATKGTLALLKDAITNNDQSAYEQLASLAKGFRGSAAGLAALPVPRELASTDLLLINTLMRMGEITSDFVHADTDPLAAILALQQYLETAQNLGKAFIDLGRIYAAADIWLPNGTPGASFVNMIANIETKQAAAKKP